MNCVVVRTKLQGIIALELIRAEIIKPPFVFLPVFQFAEREDDESLYIIYSRIASSASGVKPIHESKGLVLNSLILFLMSIRCLLSGGSIYVAGINYYALALALRMNPFARIVSFDDGNANTQKNSAYFAEIPLAGSNFKRLFARFLFPRGAAKFCRSRIRKHYTIYPHSLNIVDADKVEPLIVDWEIYLSPADLDKIQMPVRTILLGTVYRDHAGKNLEPQLAWALNQSDIYLPHPRDNSRLSSGEKVVKFEAPAEAIIGLLLKKMGSVKIFHFNSSVEASFRGDKRTEFINLLEMNDDFYVQESSAKRSSLKLESGELAT